MSKTRFKNPHRTSLYEQRLKKRLEDIRGPYFRDQTAIIHSLPFRRLKHKTQVFFSPNNDHVCTRIEHSLHVATIAATISKRLGLDDQLAYAIGLAHDLGHAPFGHSGEIALDEECNGIDGFIHEINGLRVVDKLGNRGKGLNLTFGVRDGIICHCGESPDKSLSPRNSGDDLSKIKNRKFVPRSYEGCIARIADKIAYLGRDLEDAIDGKFIHESDVPTIIGKELGKKNGEIIDTLVVDVIDSSEKTGNISISDDKFEVIEMLYKFSKEQIYRHEDILNYEKYTKRIIKELFEYLKDLYGRWDFNIENYEHSKIPLDVRFGNYLKNMRELYSQENAGAMEVVRDYVSGMTDGYALRCMKEIMIPKELSFDKIKD